MSKALIAGINQVAVDKGLDREVIFEAIEAALISAYKRNYGSIANVSSEVDRVSGEMRVFAEQEVVEDVINVRTEITQESAQKIYPDAQLGDVVKVLNTPDDFGRIAAQTAKQVILQRIREAERDTVFENFHHRVGEVISAQVRSNDNISGAISVMLDEKHECLLMRDEQIPHERLRRGDYIKLYIVDVHRSTRGPVIKLSRTHRNLLRRLMEQEIPEVRDGIVEIKSIAREPGARSKAAVAATVPGVDPVGSCVGMRGLRIQNIVNELSNEKIDVVEWSTDLVTYIANALSPAKVNSVLLDENNPIKTAIVVVPDRQLSLAIGKEGQNARLAAKLTGWRIDIKSESEAIEEGLDKLIAEQVASTSPDDLLSVAERILQDKQHHTEQEDLFSQAASAIEEIDTLPTLDEESVEFPPLEELFEQSGPKEPIRELPSLDELEPVVEIGEASTFPFEEQEEEQPDSPDDVTVVEELPEMITADMLRARRQKVALDEDFEIPAELLVGLEESEEKESTDSKDQKTDKDEKDKQDENLWKEVELQNKNKPKGKVRGKVAKKSPKSESRANSREWLQELEEDDLG